MCPPVAAAVLGENQLLSRGTQTQKWVCWAWDMFWWESPEIQRGEQGMGVVVAPVLLQSSQSQLQFVMIENR